MEVEGTARATKSPEEVDSVDGLGSSMVCVGEGGFRCGETVSYCDE